MLILKKTSLLSAESDLMRNVNGPFNEHTLFTKYANIIFIHIIFIHAAVKEKKEKNILKMPHETTSKTLKKGSFV